MPPRRGLADELADLINPAPQQELDPEGGAWGDGTLLNASDDELEQQVTKQPSRKAKEKGLQLRGTIELDDEVYRGKKTSRAAVFGEGEAGGKAPWEDLSDSDDDASGGAEDSGEGDGDSGEDVGGLEKEENGFNQNGVGKGLRRVLAGKAKKQMNGSNVMDEDSEEDDEQEGESEGDDDDDDFPDGLGGSLNGRTDGEEEDVSPDDSENDGDDDDEDMDEDMDVERRRSHAQAGARTPAGAMGLNDSDQSGHDEEDDEVKQLEREYQAMQQEEAQLVRVDAQQGAKEVMKGKAVGSQQQLWERGLELRILLQKGLLGCHKLPQPPVREQVLRKRQDIADRYNALRDAAEGCLVALSSLMTQLMMRHEDMATQLQNPPSTGAKRAHPDSSPLSPPPDRTSCTSWWSILEDQWDAFSGFRDGSLDRWHRRTRLAASASTLKTNLRALDQSISTQVASMMSGPANKRAKRAHMLTSARPKMLCHPPAEHSDVKATLPTSEAQEDDDDDRAFDTYDDTEFYQQLLKELLESGTSGGVSYAAIKSQKKRKNVDRRASKGRKIRYHVHEKLVNFATPVEMEVPPFAEHLFANLFGHNQTA